nr:MAG TPA: hypothetical protein [Caudoviricetes sp.]
MIRDAAPKKNEALVLEHKDLKGETFGQDSPPL